MNHVTLLKGPCSFRTTDRDGSFEVRGRDIFAKVRVFGPAGGPGGEQARGYLVNNGRSGSGMNEDLGALYRNGGCWSNRSHKVCAWKN